MDVNLDFMEKKKNQLYFGPLYIEILVMSLLSPLTSPLSPKLLSFSGTKRSKLTAEEGAKAGY
jgi:hypothetical protein